MPILPTLADRYRATGAAVDGAFAEPLLITPMTKNGWGPLPDPERPPFTVSGLLRLKGDEIDLGGNGGSKDWTVRLGNGQVVASILSSLLPAFALHNEDRVKAPSRPGQPEFEIIRIDTDQVIRTFLILGARGSAG